MGATYPLRKWSIPKAITMPDMITTVVLFGILQGLMVIYVFSRKERIKEHKFLLWFIGALLFVQLHSFLARSGLMAHTLFLMNTNVPLMLLFGPILYFYTRQLQGRNHGSLLTTFIHCLPFVFYTIYSFNFFLQAPEFKFNAFAELAGLQVPEQSYEQHFPSDPWGIQGWVVVELISAHLVVYSLVSILTSVKSSDGANKLLESKRQWAIFTSAILLLGGIVLFLSEGGVINGEVFFKSPLANFSGDMFSTVALYATTFYLLTKPQFLFAKNGKYEKSSLSTEYKAEKLQVIKSAIEDNKLFMRTDFSLDLLAQATGITKHHISQIINEELKQSFFELTNDYRIEEAKKVLANAEFIKMEVLAYDLGYRSKSSFFSAFKKATSLTPAKYLETIAI